MTDLNQTFAPLTTIISWFAEDAQPTEQQFETTWKSFFHKSENIPVEQIYQLVDILNLKAEREHLHLDLAKKDGSNLDVDDINGLKEVLGVALAANGIIGNVETTITSADANLLQDGIYKPKTTGVFTALGLTAQENYTTLFRKNAGVWSVFSEEKMPMQDLTEIEQKLDNIGQFEYFSKKGKYTSAKNSTIVNEDLETTDYIDISKLDYISGYGRGSTNAPTIIYFNEQNNIVDTYVGGIAGASFNILKSDFPPGAIKIKINSLLNRGIFNKDYIQELNDRINEPKKIKLKEKLGVYVNTSGLEVTESAHKATQLFPIDVASVVHVNNAYTNGFGVKPVIFFNNKKEPIGYINTTTPNEIYNIELNSENIPTDARFIRINAIINNNVYITTNTDILLADLSTKEVDTSNLVKKESGKGLYPNSDKNKVNKLIIDGIGTKVLFDDGNYKTINASGDVIIEQKFDNKNIVSSDITISKIQNKKPKVVLTFDDGRATDYTTIKPILDEYGIKGVFYVNKFDAPKKLTTEQIKEMYNEGHEFGSHTENHNILSAFAVLAPINSSDTILKVASPYGSVGFLEKETNRDMRIYCKISSVRYEFDVVRTWYESNNWWIELAEPIGINIMTNIEFFLTEETAINQAKTIKDKLESIGVECHGFAYPYGSAVDENKIAVQSLFNYARYAYGDNSLFRIFGGIYYGYNDFFDQFALPSMEIPNLTYAQIDTHISNVLTNNGVLCFLGHSVNDTSYDLYPKLRYIIEKCIEHGIEISTMKDALNSHGNLENKSYSSTNSEGLTYNQGLTVLPPNFLKVLESIFNYPVGVSTQRVYSGQENGYPEVGTIIRLNTAHKNTNKAYWTYDYFIGYLTGYLYFRRRDGTFTAHEWECLSTRKGTTFPTTILTVGCSFYRTDLNKIFYYNGTTWLDAMGNSN